MHDTKEPRNTVGVGDRTLGPGPVLVGVLNVTPDSFSDGGDFLDPAKAAPRAATMLDEGAEVIDVGGESTRPGSDPVPHEEEVRRVVPAIRAILADRPDAIVSIDTYRAATAEAALEAGARIVNDVTALRGDPRMASLAAEAGCPLILMHMLGEPKTMQRDPRYKDVVREVRGFLAARAEHAIAAGVEPENVILDPGIGFGKTLDHNLDLLANLDALVATGYPVLVGTSRKSSLGALAARADRTGVVPPAPDRLEGSIATAVWSLLRGAAMVRVHDVAATVRALDIVDGAQATAA
jgi:dihydropteroate synthase